MASAKFLEEALSTDVDESAVSAIVGSLETQLATSVAPAHQVPAPSNHQQVLAPHNNGSAATTAISNGNSGAVQQTPQAQKHVANGAGSAASTVNQESPGTAKNVAPASILGANSSGAALQTKPQHVVAQPTAHVVQATTTNQITGPMLKSQEQVKIIYSTAGQVLTTPGVINANSKIAFSSQNQLANGTLSVPAQVSNIVSNVISSAQPNVSKAPGTALVIKTSNVAQGGMVSVPMSVPVSATNTTLTTLQGKACVTPNATVPSNLQIVNMSPRVPVTTGQQANKQVGQRIVIQQQMVGARPGTPGQITLQAAQALQGGHLLVKTETGQFQLLRVGPASAAAAPGSTAVTANSITGNTVVAGQTYRIAPLPAVSRLNAQFTGPPLTTLRKPLQPAVVSTSNVSTTAAPVSTATVATSQPTPVQRQTTDNTKEKCRKFLANLLELSSREPRAVERNVRTLIQELIDTKVEPEEFCDRLEKLLNASPQPCLIGFLKKSLPLLRQSLVTKELVIEGIIPPPRNVVFPVATTPSIIRPTVASVAQHPVTIVAASSTPTTQVRAVSTFTANTPNAARTTLVGAPTTQRMMKSAIVRPPGAVGMKQTTVVSGIRSSVPISQKGNPTIMKTIGPMAQSKIINATIINKATVPSIVQKTIPKEKEKKTFSSTGYTGDDDINDVAAMGGVNLAEESQRILGSTEFVGTQIRSCKDELFLHLSPLQQKIKRIASLHNLDEPSQEVASLISHAVQERLKNLVGKLGVIAEHRVDFNKMDLRYEVTQDVKAQLKFLEELDRVERRKHDEQEREALLRLAKSRAKTEDPEQAKLKAKAKEMQRAEMEELRQREANLTALQAIGPRKRPRLDAGGSSSPAGGSSGANSATSNMNRKMPLRPRVKRVNTRDLLFLMEQEKETCRSTSLYKFYLK